MAEHKLANILAEMAVLLELKGENTFKIRAYENAARAISQLDSNVAELVATGGLQGIKGLGKTMIEHITEYVDKGTIAYYDELKSGVPAVLFELVKIPGLGSKKALLLHEKLGVHSIGELEYACRENRLKDLPGFGEKSQEKILQGIDFMKRFQGRFLLCDVWPVSEKIAEYLRSQQAISQAQVAGSIRRRLETVKDIDIVVASSHPSEAISVIKTMPGIEQVIRQQTDLVSVKLTTGINMDVRIVASEKFFSMLHHCTGSENYGSELAAQALAKGYQLSAEGLTPTEGAPVVIKSEEDLYAALGMSYIEPELREGRGEIALAAVGQLPRLVTHKDIQGAFHMHTVYSDGTATIAEMAAAAKARGWHYIGITDHSQTAVYARGLKIEAIERQRLEIARFNENNPDFTVFTGIESDILPDGSLDYPDDILAEFDFVIASVHSAFRQSETDMTARIVRAVKNKYVTMLGHLTGRILLARDGYAVDVPSVLAAAAATGTIIEINSSPYRLDLDWRWARRAKELGIMLAINPDAHAIAELDYVKYGLTAARKGGLTAADIINTRPVAEVKSLLWRKR